MRAYSLRLVLILHLVGWESCPSFVNQSQSEVKQNQSKCYNTQHWKPFYSGFLLSVESKLRLL